VGRSDALTIAAELTLEASIVATATERPRTPLTARERQALAFVAAGLTSKQIARQMSVAYSTVTVTVHHAIRKLGCQTRAQACVLAVREGIIGDVSK
jgi:two-component system, NarL family, nitrate/nitrite response regulator NarL